MSFHVKGAGAMMEPSAAPRRADMHRKAAGKAVYEPT